MPHDDLAPSAKQQIRAAEELLRSRTPSEADKDRLLGDLEATESALGADIQERETKYLEVLDRRYQDRVDHQWSTFKARAVVRRIQNEARAIEARFEHLRNVNDGGYPMNISPILYWIPLLLVAISEWYVNYSTFAARFVPVVAIACTIIVGLIFAYFSHLLGAFLAQYGEISHPSVESRRVLDRKITLIGMGVVLVLIFTATMWLRYTIIQEQLGLADAGADSVFRTETSGKIWSTLVPTIAVNIGIIAIGTVYAWFMHEKVPQLRETYRSGLSKNNKLERLRAPVNSEVNRLQAAFERDKILNERFIKEYANLRKDIVGLAQRLTKKTNNAH
jgi:hypothetical protein